MGVNTERVDVGDSKSEAHTLTDRIRSVALTEAKRFIESIDFGSGFRGAKCPLSIDGWFIHVDYKGTLRQITYEEDGATVHYNP